MILGPLGLALIKEFERCELKPYDDGYGYMTIGWGHLIRHDECFNEPITPFTAECLLVQDCAEAQRTVNQEVTVPLTQYQYDALVSFVFNVGPGRMDLPGIRGKDGFARLRDGRPSTMLRKLNAGDYLGAAAEFTHWTKVNGVESAGLLRRRKRERDLFQRV
jgi:lysozyme